MDELKIDKYNLDHEWELQPQLFNEWAEKCAEAIEIKDRAELKLKVIEAKLFKDIKTNWKDYGFDKSPTDTMAKQEVLLQEEYQQAYEELIQARKNLNVLEGAKRSFEHRKKALENITQLWVSGYYAEPYISKDAKDKVNERTREAVNKKLNSKLKRRSK